MIAPWVYEVEGAAFPHAEPRLPKRRADAFLVIDDEPEVPRLVGRLPSACGECDELIPHVDEGHRAANSAAQLEFEESPVPGQRLLDVTDLECDVVDPDEPGHRTPPYECSARVATKRAASEWTP